MACLLQPYWRNPGAYRLPTGKICCDANSVNAEDLETWFHVDARVARVQNGPGGSLAFVVANLSFRDGGSLAHPRWKPLQWSDLGLIHGRRVHVSAVSSDLTAAWHVHPGECAGVPCTPEQDGDTTLTVRLRLPLPPSSEASVLKVRLHLSFGVLDDNPNVEMCVSEKSVHIDPSPNGAELTVEGQALTEMLTLRTGVDVPPAPLDLGVTRTLTTLPLGGEGGDEVLGGRAVTRELEDDCSSGLGGGSCWGVRLSAGTLNNAAFTSLKEKINRDSLSGKLDETLFSGGALSGGGGDIDLSGIETPACIGFNVFVRRNGLQGTPANKQLTTYLTMAAHAIVARAGADSLWHLHLSRPHA